MNKKVNIPLTFHDIVNVLMWDESYNKKAVKSRIPCGTKVAVWLARAFTLANMKNYPNRGQFALSYFYKNSLPAIETNLKEVQDFYLTQIKTSKATLKKNPLAGTFDLSSLVKPIELEISVMPCPPVLMFVRNNILCDEAHAELRKMYQFGNITKSEYFRQRSELFKPLNKFRADFATKVSEAGKIHRSVDKKTGTTISSTG